MKTRSRVSILDPAICQIIRHTLASMALLIVVLIVVVLIRPRVF
ncbi:hypothetical protein D777_00442 [Marinobacter nitratireducens]|uniref:Uncharacterized protein n=1 Tax=Marinobacter nitratireducens TaxID=1137280 RepID=A0A072NI92_9GAMM|nr:hypothetical protein D777_00442 [Marinobacter nitratireducens]